MDKEMYQEQTMMMNPISITAQQVGQKQRFNIFESAICSQGNKSLLLCCAKQCKSPAIVCSDSDCKCYKNHFNPNLCSMVNSKMIAKKIEQNKHIESPQLINYIDMTLQKLIDQISQFKDKLESKVKNLGVTDTVRDFLQTSKKGHFKQLTGQTVSKVFEHLNKQSKESKQNYSQNLKKHLELKWSKIEKQIKQQLYSLEKIVDQFVNFDPFQFPFFDSKVLSNQEQRKRLVQFFPQNKRKFGSSLLYRASQNDFSCLSFHQKCDNKDHTITLVKTQFNKVIGGYTPLTWKGHMLDKSAQQDKSKQSFIFSITNNDKFKIKPGSQYQIGHFKQHGPLFCSKIGYSDLFIKDNANSIKSSFTTIDCGYSNPNYKSFDKASHERLSGQADGGSSFKITEWQVYQLTF